MLSGIAVFEVNLHTCDTNEVTRFIVFADLGKMFLPRFSGEMVNSALNSNHVLQIHRENPLCAKFEVIFVSLV